VRALPGLVLALVLVASAGAAAAPRFELVAHLDLPRHYTGDVVGHRGFAYVSSHRGSDSCLALGVRVVDVRNPRRPRLVSSFARVARTFTEKAIIRRVATRSFRGDLAVTSFQRCTPSAFQGFGVYDVTNPRRPRELARVRLDPRGSHEIWLATARGRAWVYTAILRSEQLTGDPGFRIYDVTNPRAPRQVGSWGLSAIGVDPRPAGPAFDGDFVHSVITNADATRAYLSYWDRGTVFLDVSDPTRPRYLGRTDPPEGHAHSAWLRGSLLVETHETTNGHPTVYDVSDATRPQKLADVLLPATLQPGGRMGGTPSFDLTNSVHDPKLVGDIGLFSWYSQGVVAFDLSNPQAPRFLARFLPTPKRDPESLACGGRRCVAVWGVFRQPDGTILASDIVSGLWVLRLRA
jgi:hypothetical protein